MDALSFLYWSLGIGFAVFIVFLCVALIYLIRILRDFALTSASVREVAHKVNENVEKITDKVTDVTEQIADYIVKPVSVIQFLLEKMKPVVEMMHQRNNEFIDEEEVKGTSKKKVKSSRKA